MSDDDAFFDDDNDYNDRVRGFDPGSSTDWETQCELEMGHFSWKSEGNNIEILEAGAIALHHLHKLNPDFKPLKEFYDAFELALQRWYAMRRDPTDNDSEYVGSICKAFGIAHRDGRSKKRTWGNLLLDLDGTRHTQLAIIIREVAKLHNRDGWKVEAAFAKVAADSNLSSGYVRELWYSVPAEDRDDIAFEFRRQYAGNRK